MFRSRLAMVPAVVFAMAPEPLSGEAPTPRSKIESVVRRYYAEVANDDLRQLGASCPPEPPTVTPRL